MSLLQCLHLLTLLREGVAALRRHFKDLGGEGEVKISKRHFSNLSLQEAGRLFTPFFHTFPYSSTPAALNTESALPSCTPPLLAASPLSPLFSRAAPFPSHLSPRLPRPRPPLPRSHPLSSRLRVGRRLLPPIRLSRSFPPSLFLLGSPSLSLFFLFFSLSIPHLFSWLLFFFFLFTCYYLPFCVYVSICLSLSLFVSFRVYHRLRRLSLPPPFTPISLRLFFLSLFCLSLPPSFSIPAITEGSPALGCPHTRSRERTGATTSPGCARP